MKQQQVGFFVLMLGVSLAVCFDSVALTSVGCFMAGMGLGLVNRSGT
jgi:hypothetical protein